MKLFDQVNTESVESNFLWKFNTKCVESNFFSKLSLKSFVSYELPKISAYDCFFEDLNNNGLKE